MADGIREIRQQAVTLIEAATPDYRAGYPYQELSGRFSFFDSPAGNSWADNTRRFKVQSRTVQTEGDFDGINVDQQQEMSVFLRYMPEDTPTGWDDMHDMAASDSARIEETLLRPPIGDNWSSTPLIQINLIGSTDLAEVPRSEQQALYFFEMRYLITYRLED